jgi:hypothetical protein
MIKYEITNEQVIGRPTRLLLVVIATHGSLLHKEKIEINKIDLGNKRYFKYCTDLMQTCSQEIQKQVILFNNSQTSIL